MNNHYNCIYMYVNKINNHKYIGLTDNFERRYKEHIRGKEQLIDKKIKEYGIENFEIKILAENVKSKEKLNEYEKFFIKRYNTLAKNGNGYNIADGGYSNPYEGKTEEEMNEIRKKMSENHADFKGENHPMYGSNRSGEKNPFYNRNHSESTKQEMSNKAKERFRNKENHPMYGKTHTEESKKKMSESHSGVKISEETKRKMSESKKGHSVSDETKLKISQSNKNKKRTNEFKDKLKERQNGKTHSRAKKINQYDLKGNFVKTWGYIKEVEEILGIKATNITACCKGKQKTAGGFIWKYYKEIE